MSNITQNKIQPYVYCQETNLIFVKQHKCGPGTPHGLVRYDDMPFIMIWGITNNTMTSPCITHIMNWYHLTYVHMSSCNIIFSIPNHVCSSVKDCNIDYFAKKQIYPHNNPPNVFFLRNRLYEKSSWIYWKYRFLWKSMWTHLPLVNQLISAWRKCNGDVLLQRPNQLLKIFSSIAPMRDGLMPPAELVGFE